MKTGPTQAELQHARDRARDWLLQNEETLVAELLACGDPRIKLEVWKVLKNYGDGRPTEHLTISAGKSPEETLEEIARKRFAITAEVVTEAPDPPRVRAPRLISAQVPPHGLPNDGPPSQTSGDTRKRGANVAPFPAPSAVTPTAPVEGSTTKAVVDTREAEVEAALRSWDREHGDAARG